MKPCTGIWAIILLLLCASINVYAQKDTEIEDVQYVPWSNRITKDTLVGEDIEEDARISVFTQTLTGPAFCSEVRIRRALVYIDVFVHDQEYYRNGLEAFGCQIDVDVRGLYNSASAWPVSSPLPVKFDLVVNGTTVRPAQRYVHDITVNHPFYEGTPNNQFDELTVTVTGVDQDMTEDQFDDLYIVVTLVEEYAVEVNTSCPSGIFVQLSAPTDAGTISANPITLKWQYKDGSTPCEDAYPMAELQLLRLYNESESYRSEKAKIKATVDWSKAQRMYLYGYAQEATFTLAEGTGYYAWRVRPIGNKHEGGAANPLNWGCWSASPDDGEVIDESGTVVGTNVNAIRADHGAYSVFHYTQFDADKNWQFSRAFMEDKDGGAGIVERMMYASRSGRVVQEQAAIKSSGDVVVSQTVQDYQGRPLLKTLPTPADRVGTTPANIQYRAEILGKTSSTSPYTAREYDGSSTATAPESADGRTPTYYGGTVLVPHSNGYPFTREVLSNDPLARPVESSGPGSALKIGAGHTAKTKYAQATEEELISMFGMDAPNDSSVAKTISIDQNGVVSLTYTRNDGKVIATCLLLTGPNENLLELNDRSNMDTIKQSDTLRRGIAEADGKIVATQDFYLFDERNVEFKYFLDPQDFTASCASFCRSCDYALSLEVVSESGSVVLGPTSATIDSSTCPSAGTYTYPTSRTLAPGKYTMRRTLTPKQVTPMRVEKYVEDVRNAHAASAEVVMSDIFNSTGGPTDLDSLRRRQHLTDPKLARRLLHAYKAFRDSIADTSGNAILEVNDCCNIILPATPCTTGCEPGVTYDYEQILINRWKDTVEENSGLDGDSLANYFTYADTAEYLEINVAPYPDGGAGLINALINSMLTLTTDPYDCGEVYDCWIATVEQYWSKGWEQHSDGFWHRRLNYNLLNEFLDCVGTRYCGRIGPNIKTGTGGWISNAWRLIPRSANHDQREICEDLYQNSDDYITSCTVDPVAANETWRRQRDCYEAQRVFNLASTTDRDRWLDLLETHNPEFDRDDLENCDKPCVEEKLARWVDTCETECEARRGRFQDSVIRMYQNAMYAVEGATGNPLVPIGTKTYYEVACLVNTLVASCKEDCQLTVEWDQTDSLVKPTAEEMLRHVQARTATSFRVVLPVEDSCPNSLWRHLDEVRIPMAEYLADILNDALLKYRDTVSMTLSRWNIEPIFREFLLHYPLPDICLPDSLDSLDLLDTLGLEVHPYSRWSVMVDLSQDTKFSVLNDSGICELRYRVPISNTVQVGYTTEDPHPLVDILNDHLNSTWLKKVDADYLNDYTITDQVSTNDASPWTWFNVTTGVPGKIAFADDSLRPDFSCDPDGLEYEHEGWELCDDELMCINGVSHTLSELTQSNKLLLKSRTSSLVQRTPSDDSILYAMSRFDATICGFNLHTQFELDSTGDTMTITVLFGGIPGTPVVTRTIVVGDSTDIDSLLALGSLTDWLGRFVQRPNGLLGFEILLDGADDVFELPCMNFTCERPIPDSCLYITICSVCDTLVCGDVCYRWVMNDTLTPNITIKPLSCAQAEIERIAGHIESQLYGTCLDEKLNQIEISYKEKCLDPLKIKDHFVAEWNETMYHYTLYYYDRAGNLVKTIPPKGFIPFDYTKTRAQSTGSHQMPTTYAFNTIGQLVREKSPDGGETKIWYDRIGRVRLSQDAKQLVSGYCTFMDYDALSRVVHSGEADISNPQNHAETQTTTSCISNRVVTTYTSSFSLPAPYSALVQRNLRHRISHTLADLDADTTTSGDLVRTYYSYDAHGNVEWMIQDLPGPGTPSRLVTRTEYEYDLISDKVTQFVYQRNRYDQFFQRYEYDQDQRVTKVETSRDGHLWERDVTYTSYVHGPLKRVEYGTDRVQGQDYIYTIDSRLKAINHVNIDGAMDAGADGTNIHVGRDAFGMVLGYHENDYGNNSGSTYETGDQWYRSGKNLYNGNIATWTSNSRSVNGTARAALASVYSYDLDNRLRRDEVYKANTSTPRWDQENPTNWLSEYEYDGNGNITELRRNTESVEIDNLVYDYPAIAGTAPTNQLNYIDDNQTSASLVSYDLDDQSASNYAYDAAGNLIKDVSAGISLNGILWTNANNIRSITKGTASKIEYVYDARGERILKRYYEPANTLANTTWYVRNAQGLVVAVYAKSSAGNLTLTEHPVYGVERVGLDHLSHLYTTDTVASHDTLFSRILRKKSYELTDQLDNVRVVVSDLVKPATSNFLPDVLSAIDYYPFGMAMAERSENQGLYRYGFNGKENDNELKGDGNQQDYGFRMYDPRVTRFMSADPLSRDYPSWGAYTFAMGRPIDGIDLDGLEFFPISPVTVGKAVIKVEKAVKYVAKILPKVLTYTDVNDVAVLVTTFTRGGDAVNIDGTPADGWDILFAGAGLLAPGVSGSAVKKGGQKLLAPATSSSSKAKRASQTAPRVKSSTGGKVASRNNVQQQTTTVIGRVQDLQKLGPGEQSLLDRLPDLGSPKANWKQNSGVLRQEMNRGLPIRDASVGNTGGQFLNAERNLLRDRGWTFDGSYWKPPSP